jgi:SAM-dependent methyltransferase
MRVLDLGCGTGSWARAFHRWWPGIEVVAVEPSAAMRQHAVFEPVLAGDAGRIPLESASLDAVWEAVEVLDRYPSVDDVDAAFAGFEVVGFEPVAQVTAASLLSFAAALRRSAHTPLQLISDEAYAAGVAQLRAAAESQSGPVVDALDLLVLRRGLSPSRPPRRSGRGLASPPRRPAPGRR